MNISDYIEKKESINLESIIGLLPKIRSGISKTFLSYHPFEKYKNGTPKRLYKDIIDNDITWYNGGLYNATDRWDICRKPSTSAIDASTAQTAYTLFNLNSSGAAYNATGTWGTISSDQRLKENIVDATSKLNDVLSLQVRNFNYIGKEEKYIGFIAQELEQVFPSLVTTNDMREFDRDGNVVGGLEDTKGVKVGMDFAILVKAIQELSAKVEILEAEIQTLKQ
jgi:hypothetical protein